MMFRTDIAKLLSAAEDNLNGAQAQGGDLGSSMLLPNLIDLLALARRELASDTATLTAEFEMLRGLYGDQAAEAAGHNTESRVHVLNRRLAADIRTGALDGACAIGVRRLLFDQVRARLAISNPAFLARVTDPDNSNARAANNLADDTNLTNNG